MNSEVYQSWEDRTIDWPVRSRLYHLEPIKKSGVVVESFTSFFLRLAAAHCWPPWVLVKHEITVGSNRKWIDENGHCDLLGKLASSLNGHGETAAEILRTVELLTG